MKLNQFSQVVAENNVYAGINDTLDEHTSQVPEPGDTIRTKKVRMEGRVERLGTNRNGHEEVFFRLADGRLMRSSLSNVTVIEKITDEEIGESIRFGNNTPDVDHMNGPVYRGGDAPPMTRQPQQSTNRKQFSDFEKWNSYAQHINSEVYDDNSDIIGDSYSSTYRSPDNKMYAEWNKERKIGFVTLPTNEGVTGGIAGAMAGAVVKKSPGGAMSGYKIGSSIQDAVTKEGSVGGINRSAPSTDVSYEKVLDEVQQKWLDEQMLSELSVNKMRDFQQKVKSPDRFRTASMSQLSRDVEGNARASRKIATKTGDRRRDPPRVAVDEADIDFSQILQQQQKEYQATKKIATVDIAYNGWTIRYRPAAKSGEKVRWQAMDGKDTIKGKGEAMTDKEAVAAAEEYIKKGGGAKKESNTSVTIDFNVNFTKEFGDEFYSNIMDDDGVPALLISYEDMSGMKRAHTRNQKHKMTSTTTRLTSIPMSATEANTAGLSPNGRYLLGSKEDLGNGISKFPLIYQSTVQGKGDMMRLGRPGLTVAHNREVTEACWKDYKQLGMKKKGGKSVPNCVPKTDEAYEGPWQGDSTQLAKSPKSTMMGSKDVPFDQLVKDTIKTHGLKWAFDYYVKKNGLSPRQFQIFAGLTTKRKNMPEAASAQTAAATPARSKDSQWRKMVGRFTEEGF
jgi:hypothetical protein